MTNRPKDIGTRGETGVVRYLRNVHSFPENRARRVTLSGQYDLGDVHAEFPDGSVVAIEVKAGKQADAASLLQIADWQQEATLEATHSDAASPLLIVKRRGVAPSRMELWRAFFPILSPAMDRDVWVEMAVHEAIRWFEDQFGSWELAVPFTRE